MVAVTVGCKAYKLLIVSFPPLTGETEGVIYEVRTANGCQIYREEQRLETEGIVTASEALSLRQSHVPWVLPVTVRKSLLAQDS